VYGLKIQRKKTLCSLTYINNREQYFDVNTQVAMDSTYKMLIRALN